MRPNVALRRLLMLMIGLSVIAQPMACSTAKIEVNGGTGIIGPRRIKVGESFIVRQPFDRNTGAEWSLGTYDHALLQPVPRFAYETAADGSMSRVYEFKAKSVGFADIEFLHRRTEPIEPGQALPERQKKTIRVKIIP